MNACLWPASGLTLFPFNKNLLFIDYQAVSWTVHGHLIDEQIKNTLLENKISGILAAKIEQL
jgi:hypothetical protein